MLNAGVALRTLKAQNSSEAEILNHIEACFHYAGAKDDFVFVYFQPLNHRFNLREFVNYYKVNTQKNTIKWRLQVFLKLLRSIEFLKKNFGYEMSSVVTDQIAVSEDSAEQPLLSFWQGIDQDAHKIQKI